jgi:hypothetical protein
MRMLAIVVLGSAAHADVVAPHINAGLEVAGSGDATRLAGRAHIGASVAFGDARVRPSIGFGATVALGSEETTMQYTRFTEAAPALQVGASIGNDGLLDDRIWAGLAAWDGTTRFSLGGSLAKTAFDLGTSDETRHGYLMIVMPQQIELAWTRDDHGS